MSKYNDTLLTTAGQALATRAANGSAKFSITRAVGSKTDLSGKTDAELVALTSLPDETQVAQIVAQVDDPDGSTGITGTQVTFQNKNENASIDEGYTLNTIGLFAKEEGSDKEILYALTTADQADYIPDFADNVFYKFTITIYVVVGQKANVTVAIDVTGTASIEYVDNAVAKAMQNLPKDIARTGTDNKFTGANDFQKATVKGVNVATTADVNAKQDKIGYTPADDSKVVHNSGLATMPTENTGLVVGNNGDIGLVKQTGSNGTIGVGSNNAFRVVQSNNRFMGIADTFHDMFKINGNYQISLGPGAYFTPADDRKVAHLSGANNFDTVPTVKNKPIITAKKPGIPKLAVNYNATSKAFDYTLTAPEKDGFSDILQYNLLWKDHSVDDWTTVIVNPDDLTGQLTGVDTPKTYDFKAAAQNAVGSSDYTDVVTLVTVDGNIYGVSWDGSSSGALQRTDAAVGLKAGINGAQNDFDTRGPWGLMDKTVKDSYGNAFVRVPKFYIRKTQNKPSSTWQVSLVKQGDDWYLPNCFYDFDTNKELDYVDVSRYEGSIASGKLQSKTGATPTDSQTIVQLRSSAVANNTDSEKGYHLWDVHTLDALQVLFTIEFATLDSQSIMQGNDSGANLINNGATDNVKGSSGFVTSGSKPMTYRGIENLYGNLAMWTDGLNISNLSLYSCDDATKYASDVFASPYYKLNYSLQSGSSNITGLGFDKDHPSVEAPTSSNDDQYNTYYHDYSYVNGSGNYVVDTGGSWAWGAGLSGLWYWRGGYSSTDAYSNIGSRLLKKAL